MPTFEYIVRTQDGKRIEGKIDAENLNRANEKLLEKKFTIVKLTENEVTFDFLGPFLDRLNLEMEKIMNNVENEKIREKLISLSKTIFVVFS